MWQDFRDSAYLLLDTCLDGLGVQRLAEVRFSVHFASLCCSFVLGTGLPQSIPWIQGRPPVIQREEIPLQLLQRMIRPPALWLVAELDGLPPPSKRTLWTIFKVSLDSS